MGFHWDTPDFWVRSETDEILREFDGIDICQVLESFERNTTSYDAGPEMAAMVIDELRHRAAAGLRFWPAADGVALGPHGPLLVAAPDVAAIDEDHIPW
jgi:hypothetical protein